jgi:hypothetical protein
MLPPLFLRPPQIAIKFERLDSKHPQLVYEGRVLRSVHSPEAPLTGFPLFRWAGEVGTSHLVSSQSGLGGFSFSFTLNRYDVWVIWGVVVVVVVVGG